MESGAVITRIETLPERFRREAVQSLPRLVAEAGAGAAFAWDECFSAQLRNPHTRAAYSRAVRRFLGWLEEREISLTQVTPGMIGTFFDELDGSIPTKKLALAAIRRFFDALTMRHVLAFNPALSVRVFPSTMAGFLA